MTHGMTELMTLTRSRAWSHQGSPVAEYCFDSVEVRHRPASLTSTIWKSRSGASRAAAWAEGQKSSRMSVLG